MAGHRVHVLAKAAVLTVVLVVLYAPGALAASPSRMAGAITNVHAVGGEIWATYRTDVDVLGSWYAFADQHPGSQSCTPEGPVTYVGQSQAGSGSETTADYFYPAYRGGVRVCLYVSHDSVDYLVDQVVFTPPTAISGSIRHVHTVHGQAQATYTTSFDMCTLDYCGWIAQAYQYPASQSCHTNGSHTTYVGDVHTSAGTETKTATFSPTSDGVRICLYAAHVETEYFVAQAVYFRTPAPTQRTRITVGDQRLSFYYPRACVIAGRAIQLKVASETNRTKSARTSITRVHFSLDLATRTIRRAGWQASFATQSFAPRSLHQVIAKITLRQAKRLIVRKLSRRLRIC